MAKKSLLEKLGLVESDEPVVPVQDQPDEEPDLNFAYLGVEPTTQDTPEVPEGDMFDIQAVYAANDMDPADAVTVYKIQDVLASLPAEMPSKTKKTTIKSLMTTLGYDAVAIETDASSRIELLKSAGNEKMNALFAEMKENDQKIESMKEEIEALTTRNTEAGNAIEQMATDVQNEVHKIESVLEFVRDEPVAVNKEGVQ